MIKLQECTPKVYYEKSRDFQLLGRLYDLVLNSVKTGADSLYYLPTADSTMQTQLLDLLSYTLGFTAKHNYNNAQLAAVCSVFPTLLKNKGSLAAIRLLGDTLVHAEGITEKFDCVANGTTLDLYIPSSLSSTTLLNDLLDYILPAGITCNIIRTNTEAMSIVTEVDVEASGVRMFYDKAEQKVIDLTKLSIIPSLSSDITENKKFISNYNRYTNKTTGVDDDDNEIDIYSPTKGMMVNSAVLDYNGISGVSADNSEHVFYDIKYQLPIKLGETSYGLDIDAMELFGKSIGVSYDTPKKLPVGYADDAVVESDTESSMAVSVSYETEVQTDTPNRVYAIMSSGTRLAGAVFNFPNKTLLEKIYNQSINVAGYQVEISKVSPTNIGFSLYPTKTATIAGLLKDDEEFSYGAVKTLDFKYNGTTLFGQTLMTEVIDNLVNGRISPECLGKIAKKEFDAGNNVCGAYYTSTASGIIQEQKILIADTTGNYTPVIIMENEAGKRYPILTYCFTDVEATAYSLPQLYRLDTAGKPSNVLHQGRFIFKITPIFE